MRNQTIFDLADCTEFRQALQARPPRVVHGTVTLLAVLLGTALGWAALTRANLVVRGPGRIRPVTTPVKVYNAGRGEALSATVGGWVVEANAREGDQVRRGDVLIRLVTGRLDNEIARQVRLIRAGEEELARLERLGAVQAHQFEAARAKAEADLQEAREAIRVAKDQQAAEVCLARVALTAAEQEEAITRRLAERSAIAREELAKTAAKSREARERLAKARIPVQEGQAGVAQRALALVEQDYAVKREELELKRGTKRGEVEAARLELANRELEREQSVIRAPIDGIITAGDVKVGDVLEPGKPVAEISRQAGFVFEAVVPSEEIGHVRVGMPARVKLDPYDYQRYGVLDGTVCFVSPDSGVPESQAKGVSMDSERPATPAKAVYTLRISLPRAEIGREAYRGRIKLGMSGLAEVVTGQECLLSLLVKRIRQTISLG
jgi:multidrug resistance efflux pump